MRQTLATIQQVAPTDVSVLILGETGTGKELAARALAAGSPRADQPFVAVNCAALSESLIESELFGHEPGAFTGATGRKIGKLERANCGTLFLDEIGDLPAKAQAKLLRALQERVIERVGGCEDIPVDFRLIAATNRDLRSEVAAPGFRRDLFFRLSVVTVVLPPLRHRDGDILSLAEHFMSRAQKRLNKSGIELDPDTRASLLAYPWPGNVRELENLCTRLVALSCENSRIRSDRLDLFAAPQLSPGTAIAMTSLRDILELCEREIVRRALDRCGQNRTHTAEALGISRQALQQKLAKFRAAPKQSASRTNAPSRQPTATTRSSRRPASALRVA